VPLQKYENSPKFMTKNEAPRFIPKDIIPTTEQTNIQLSRSKISIVEANAGAAKTTTLALRLAEAIARNLEPENMLALVFTPEARDVLKKRLVEIGVPYATAARIRVDTFEDFARQTLEIIEERKSNYIAESKHLKEFVLQALAAASDRYLGQVEYLEIQTHNLAISQFLQTQLHLKATMALQVANRDFELYGLEDSAEQLGIPLAHYLTFLEYEQLRGANEGCAYFRGPFDATYDLASLLHNQTSLREQLPRYRLIVCDELHDTNEASFQILQHLIDPTYSYFVGAGDCDQVIHSKLGASDTFMRHRFTHDAQKAVAFPLTYTYRHGPFLAYAMAAFKRKEVESAIAEHTDIHMLSYEESSDNDNCAEQVIKSLLEWKKQKHPLNGCAILIRDRHQSIALENAMMQAEIDYHTGEMKPYLQREEILFLRGMIAITLKNFANVKSEKIRKEIFDALVIFGEVNLSDTETEQFRQSFSDDPNDSLKWFFSTRLQQSFLREVRVKLEEVIAAIHAAKTKLAPDLVLGELRSRLSQLNEFLQSKQVQNNASQEFAILSEVDGKLTSLMSYMEQSILHLPATALLQNAQNNLLSILMSLKNTVENDLKQRLANVVAHVEKLDENLPAHEALEQICQLMDIAALAKRLYVHPYDAKVVAQSLIGFIDAARKMKMNLRDFSDWIGRAEDGISGRKSKQMVLLECVANAKGKEFDHVILPYLQKDAFPSLKADPKEEENLFYVAATRTKKRLTLIFPKDDNQRSPYIARMKLKELGARADAAVERNREQGQSLSRIEFKANGDDWAIAKSLGAHWDYHRKVFYLKDGQDTQAFVRWL
jgi:superfamily I DNA/RNA helicase